MSNVAPGWYPDPAGSDQQRWWDGSNWGSALQATPAPAAPAIPAYGSLPAATPYSYDVGRPNSGVDPSTPFSWMLALLPLTGIISLLLSWALGDFSKEVLLNDDPFAVTPGTLAGYALGFVVWIAGAFIALADQRALEAKGITKPFPWAWAFVPVLAPLTYLIGRTVVVKRETGKGLAPLFIWISITIGIWILSFGIGIVLAAVLIGGSL